MSRQWLERPQPRREEPAPLAIYLRVIVPRQALSSRHHFQLRLLRRLLLLPAREGPCKRRARAAGAGCRGNGHPAVTPPTRHPQEFAAAERKVWGGSDGKAEPA